MKTLRAVLLLAILSASALQPVYGANWLCQKIFIGNRDYREGEIIKSPMKVEPLPVRLYKNLAFYAGMVNYPARNIVESPVNVLSDYQFLNVRRAESRLGKVNSFYDPEFDTKIYHTVSGKALPDGTMPVVDPDSNGLFVYLHGSGTNKAGGANFAYKSNELSKLGFSAMSFDLPFHTDGSQSRKLADTEKFMAQLDRLIQKYKIPGKPVYLAGHSFGPELLFEYITRYPHGVDGAIALSPAAFNDELNAWFMKVTSQATSFWGDTRPNSLGGVWGGHVTGNSLWNRPETGRADPTLVNPNLKLLVLTGDWEEYAPGPLQPNGEPAKESRTYDICKALSAYFANFTCTREPGVGHYIFTHKDEHGNDVVLRELLRATQKTPEEMTSFPARMASELKRLKAETDARKLSEIDRLAQRYARETLFRQWFDSKMGGLGEIQRLIQAGDQPTALFYSKQFDLILQQREAQLKANAQKLAEQGFIQGSNPDALMVAYFKYLEEMNPEDRDLFYKAKPSFYELSEEALAAIRPKAPREKPREQSSAQSVTLPGGEVFEFDMNQKPAETQVPFVVDQVREMRNAKLFKESQPLLNWIKRWVDLKYNKDGSVESWAYKA